MVELRDQHEMQEGWNARAEQDPFFYIETKHWNGDVDEFFERGERTTRLVIDRFDSQYGSARDVALDLGCGLGRFSRALAQRYGSVIAIDISEQMIANARQLHPWPLGSNIEFQTSDGIHFPTPNNAVDFIWSYEVLQHAPSHEIIRANIAEIDRVLRPGGWAMIHFKTGYQHPIIRSFARYLPKWLVEFGLHVTGKDPMMADRSFMGARPLSHDEIEDLFGATALSLLQIVNDPTHSAGTRSFAIVSKTVQTGSDP
jgi:ubiquinone/menaquinone biosynthesis C-methylase UbiE